MRWGLNVRSVLGRGDWREDVSAYMDDELSPRERSRVAARLAGSAEMREYLADLEEMRSVLRSFEPEPSAAPFLLTTEMLNGPARVSAQPSSTARALRLSMSTAAVGVATFAAVMVFDAVDSPTVNFTTTSADEQAARIPTAAVVTDEAEAQVQSAQASDLSALESEGQPDGQLAGEPASGEIEAAAQEEEADEPSAVASVAVAEEQSEAELEVSGQAAQAEQEPEAVEPQAASDPSRRAITAGRGGSSSESDGTQSVSAEDVVQQQEPAAAPAIVEQSEAEEPEPAASTTAVGSVGDDPPQAEASAREVDDEQAQATAETQSGTQSATRTVAASVRQAESDWPLEQRPRSSTVQLATDPSWERPVQIVLAAIAISATVFWLVLTVVDRRRRA